MEEPAYRERAREHRNESLIRDLVAALRLLADSSDRPPSKWEQAWRRAEVIGLWAAALVGISAIIVSTIDAHLDRQLTRAQLAEMRYQQRAWVKVDLRKVDVIEPVGLFLRPPPKGPLQVLMNVDISNTGLSPGYQIRISALAYSEYSEFEGRANARERAVKQACRERSSFEGSAQVGPRATIPIRVFGEVKDSGASPLITPKSSFDVFLCTTYRIEGSDKGHYSGAWYSIGTSPIDKKMFFVHLADYGD